MREIDFQQHELSKNIKKLTAVKAQTITVKEVNTAVHYDTADILCLVTCTRRRLEAL